MMKWITLVFALCCTSFTFATDYYVGGAGAADSNPGTAAQPFATIQKAASVAKAGDVVNIRGGVYRETITPANSGPITFQPDNGATVLISGLNVVDDAGWAVHNGSIYKKTITLPIANYGGQTTSNTALLANQIFKDGEMQFEASTRSLSTVDDLFDISKWKALPTGFGVNSLTDAALSGLNLAGGKLVSLGWFWSISATITSQSGNTINYNAIAGQAQFRKYYFVVGKLSLLNQAKEWFYDASTSTLYFQQTGGGSPTGLEYKARNWAFDLRNKSNISIVGLTFKGCEPVMGNASTNYITVDKIRATYTNHSITHETQVWQGYGNAIQTGVGLRGVGNTIKNSELKYGGSQGVWIGANGTVHNNLIERYGYDGMWGAGVSFWGSQDISNITVSNNTIRYMGRGCIDNGYTTAQNQSVPPRTRNNRITMNDLSHWSYLNQDAGAFYAWGWQDVSGGRIDHNWFHDNAQVPYPVAYPDGTHSDGISTGIYFDMGSGPDPGQPTMVIDHNVFWNNSANATFAATELADYHTLPAYEYAPGQPNYQVSKYAKQPTKIYNNTFGGNHKSYNTYQTAVKDIMRNNIFRKDVNLNWGAAAPDALTCLLQGVTPQFTAGDLTSLKGLYFRLNPSSPGRDAGTVIPGITDGSVGTPDIGAYEYGGSAWVPGYIAVASTPTANTPPTVSITAPANNSTFAPASPITITANATDNGSVTRVEFFSGTTKIGEDLTSPYSFVWNNATTGTYAITAKATDDSNSVTTSAAVTIIVSASAPPTVAITSPSANALITTGATVTITANATDNGSITKVEFYNGTTKIGEVTAGPYSFTWTNAPNGTVVLTAKAYDNQNNVTTSAAVTVTIGSNTAPVTAITAPANGATFNTGTPIVITATASDANGTITKVEFYSGTTKLGEDTTSPYSFTWSAAPAGTFPLTVKAYDNSANVTTSAAVSITVGNGTGQNAIPTVQIASPLNNAIVAAGTVLNVTASASDVDGSVAKVEFYSGATKLGEDNSSPYAYVWSNVAIGSYALTAKAIDNQGGIGTSTTVNITVSTSATANPAISAGQDVSVALPLNSATLVGTGSSTTGATLTYTWTQISGPSDVSIANPNAASILVDGLVMGEYVFQLTVTDSNGLMSTDEVSVTVSDGTGVALAGIPRYFTPNSDGVNDTWQWSESQLSTTSELTVFNRFGQKVYENSAYNNNWDGNSGGQALQDDAYYYVIRRENEADIQGAVRIIR